MVQANELRIGNWLRYADGSGYGKVSFLSEDRINELMELDDVEGIPLTPELLEKCGLLNQKDLEEFKFDFANQSVEFAVNFQGSLSVLSNIDNNGRQYYVYEKPNKITIKHLHQLQNLYFALTGEELTVSLGTPIATDL